MHTYPHAYCTHSHSAHDDAVQSIEITWWEDQSWGRVSQSVWVAIIYWIHTQTHTTVDSLIIQSGPNVNFEIAVYSLKSIDPQVFLNRSVVASLDARRSWPHFLHRCLCRQTQTFETRIYVYTNTHTHILCWYAMALPYARTGGCSHSVSKWIFLLRIKQMALSSLFKLVLTGNHRFVFYLCRQPTEHTQAFKFVKPNVFF